jgi:hypothetical protein
MGHFSTIAPPAGAVDLHTQNKAGTSGVQFDYTASYDNYSAGSTVLTVSITLSKPCVVVAVAHVVQRLSASNWKIYQDGTDITVERVLLAARGYKYDYEVMGKVKLTPGTYTFTLKDPTYSQDIFSASLHVIAVE